VHFSTICFFITSNGRLLNYKPNFNKNVKEVYRQLLDRKRTVQSNLELRKAKLWDDSRNCWRNAEETLEMILACWTSLQKSYEIDAIPDATFVFHLSVS